MVGQRTPLHLSHAPVPDIRAFALLAALEAGIRGTLLSVMPLLVYRAMGDAASVSRAYFIVGIASLTCGLMVPWINRFVPRRWLMTGGLSLYLVGMICALMGNPVLALFLNAVATVTFTVCLNAYVLDYIERSRLGKNETLRMVYSAAPWTIGPVAGVWLVNWWEPAPFLVGLGFGAVLIAVFWRLRLGNGKQITRAKAPAASPLAYLGRFWAQPRLIAGWSFAVIRSCGWWVYVVYLPIFCIEAGLSDKVGGTALSLSNAFLFTTPLMLRVVNRYGVRQVLRASFAMCGAGFILAMVVAPLPWVVVGALFCASIFLVMLDVSAGLPFLMAVKPSERTEMAAVYSRYRDVSGFATPAVAWVMLLFAPVSGVFAACGVAMFGAWHLAGRLHPRLGSPKPMSAAQIAEGERLIK